MRIIVLFLIVVFMASAVFSQGITTGRYGRSKVYAGPEAAVPFGRFRDISNVGYGCSAGFIYNFDSFEPGISTGFYYFNGKEEMTDRLILIPLLASAGYRFKIPFDCYLEPKVSAGSAFVILKQDPDSFSYIESPEYETKTAFEPMFKGGFTLRCTITDDTHISAVSEYAAIYESSGLLQFVILGVSATYLF